jgi:hypothetical protein
VGLIFAVGVRLFSFTLIDDIYFDFLEVVIVIMLIWYNVIVNKKINTPFTFYVKAIIALSLLSSIPAYFFHDQNFSLSLLTSRIIFFWLLYFTFHKMNISPKKMEKLLVVFGVLWSIIMIVQQFTYPYILFDVYHGVTYEDGMERNVDIRGGIIRVWIAGVGFSYFLASYMWQKIYEKLSFKNLFLFSIVLAAILLMQSRQVIFGLMLVFTADIILSFRINNFKTVRFTTIFIGLAVIFFAVAGDFIFALIELSKEQKVTSSDYIRGLEIEFFLFKYWPDPLCYIIGNGWEHDASPYGVEIKEKIKWGLGLYRSDIGMIGAFNKFGIIYIIVIIMFYIKVLIPKRYFIVPKYIRIFFVLCALTSFTGSNFFENPSYFLPFVCLLYIIDKTNEQYFYRNSHLQQTVTDAERYSVAA